MESTPLITDRQPGYSHPNVHQENMMHSENCPTTGPTAAPAIMSHREAVLYLESVNLEEQNAGTDSNPVITALTNKYEIRLTKRSGIRGKRQNDSMQEDRIIDALKRYYEKKKSGDGMSMEKVASALDLPEAARARAVVKPGTLDNHKTNLIRNAKRRHDLKGKGKVPIDLLLEEILHYETVPAGNPNSKNQKFFSDVELDCMCYWLVDQQIFGHTMNEKSISDWINFVADDGIKMGRFNAAARTEFGEKWVRKKFLKREAAQRLNLKPRKHSPIDPKRAAQAKREVAVGFFDLVNGNLAALHEQDPDVWKFSSLGEIPAHLCHYADEFGANTNEKNGKVIGTDNLSGYYFGDDGTDTALIDRIMRLYSTTEGDKGQNFHTSIFEFTRGDGVFRLQDPVTGKVLRHGAPISVIMHESRGGDALRAAERSEDNPALVAAGPAAKKNVPENSGYLVLQTKNGSQTRESFMECAKHFVSQLPPGVGGPDGEMAYLFVDGHTSRWNLEALYYLRENHVTVICIPSHCSIWAAPNDAGANRAIKAYNGAGWVKWRRENAVGMANAMGVAKKLDKGEFNKVFIESRDKFVTAMHQQLEEQQGKNTITKAWEYTGLIGSAGPNARFWLAAIASFGQINRSLENGAGINGTSEPRKLHEWSVAAALQAVGPDDGMNIRAQQNYIRIAKAPFSIQLRRIEPPTTNSRSVSVVFFSLLLSR